MKRQITLKFLNESRFSLTDFHTHSVYSGGNLSITEIMNYAKLEGLSIGVADQYSWHRYKRSKVTRQIDKYLNELNSSKKEYHDLLRGIEIDTTSIHRFTDFEQYANRLDYCLFEFVLDLAGNYSYDPKRRNRTLDHLHEIARFGKETGLLVGLSRPDPTLVFDQHLLQKSFDFIEKTGIAVELNEKHGNYYTPIFLKEVVSRNIPLICGTSAHELENICKFPFVSDFIFRNRGIEKRIVNYSQIGG